MLQSHNYLIFPPNRHQWKYYQVKVLLLKVQIFPVGSLKHQQKAQDLTNTGVPNLQDLMPDDLRQSWRNNRVYNRCKVLESSWNHPPDPGLWKNCLPGNRSLVPKRLGTAGLTDTKHPRRHTGTVSDHVLGTGPQVSVPCLPLSCEVTAVAQMSCPGWMARRLRLWSTEFLQASKDHVTVILTRQFINK